MNEYLVELEEKAEKRHGKWHRPTSWKTCEPPTRLRRLMVEKYAWAIPNDEAIQTLVDNDPIIEIGAGNGYWAYLVDKAGGDITAVDKDPPDEDEKMWYHIYEADHRFVRPKDEWTLFMCWPSYSMEWTAEAVEYYGGDTLIYVGEGRGGCTGNERFHEVLDEKFGMADETVEIPQWRGIRDKMYVFRR
jgi:hypothetical protein